MTKMVADEEIARLARQQHDVFERVRKGSLDPRAVALAVQRVIDANLVALRVDYLMSMEDMVADGEYDYVDTHYINSDMFPLVQKVGSTDYLGRLFYFGRPTSKEKILEEMGREGFVPCDVATLLSYGARFHQTQVQFDVVALGQLHWLNVSRCVVAVLDSQPNGRRGIRTTWANHEKCWSTDSRFLGVRKVS